MRVRPAPGRTAVAVTAIACVLLALQFPAHAPAATVRVSHGAADFVAAPGEENDVVVALTDSPGSNAEILHIVDSGATIVPGPGCMSPAPNEATCRLPRFGTWVFAGFALGDGADSFDAAQTSFGGRLDCALMVSGGPGDDRIIGSTTVDCLFGGDGADQLEGIGGDDLIRGGAAEDALAGGEGADVLHGGTGTDDLDGGAGFDTTSYAGRAAAVRVDLDGEADDGVPGENDAASGVEGIVGGRAADVLVGDGGPNSIHGGGGPDLIRGGEGHDYLLGADGPDDVAGGPGNDVVVGDEDWSGGNPGPDRLRGGSGNDRLRAIDGRRDVVHGGAGYDRAWVDRALDRLVEVEAPRYRLF